MDWDKQKKAGKQLTIGMAIFQVLFAVVWCLLAAAAGGFMLIFGLPFLGFAIYRLVILLKIAGDDKKPEQQKDPWDRPQERREPFQQNREPFQEKREDGGFCPYCGAGVDGKFTYCPSCGRKLH